MLFKSSNLATLAGMSLAIALSFTAPASALVYGSIPGSAATNDGLVPVYGSSDPRYGWYGAQLYLAGTNATVSAELLGSEAGLTNTFTFAGNNLVLGGTSSSGTWVANPANNLGIIGPVPTASGLLSFLFSSSSGASVANGSNPDGSGLNSPINFFVSFATNTADNQASSGTELILWLDDGGAGPDDNHDDLVIRLKVAGGVISTDPNFPAPGETPLPAAGFLFASVAGGYGFLRMRAKKAAKKA